MGTAGSTGSLVHSGLPSWPGCPKSEGFIFPPHPLFQAKTHPLPSKDKKQSLPDSAGPSSNLFIPQMYIKRLLCAWTLGLLGELSLQVKGRGQSA